MNSQANDGSTALMLAAQNGHEQVHSSQFEYAVSCRQLRCTRFHTFCSHHLEQVLRALLEAKADPEKQTLKGSTALILAAQNGHEQVHDSQFENVDSLRQPLCAQIHTFSSHHLEQVLRALL